jgi:hypothetical protein
MANMHLPHKPGLSILSVERASSQHVVTLCERSQKACELLYLGFVSG